MVYWAPMAKSIFYCIDNIECSTKIISDRSRALFRAYVLPAAACRGINHMGTNLTRLMTILMKLLAEFIIWKMGENENMCNLYLSHYFIILFIFFFNEILPELCWRSFSNSPYLRAETSDTVWDMWEILEKYIH